jgi:hypothetical protein
VVPCTISAWPLLADVGPDLAGSTWHACPSCPSSTPGVLDRVRPVAIFVYEAVHHSWLGDSGKIPLIFRAYEVDLFILGPWPRCHRMNQDWTRIDTTRRERLRQCTSDLGGQQTNRHYRALFSSDELVQWPQAWLKSEFLTNFPPTEVPPLQSQLRGSRTSGDGIRGKTGHRRSTRLQ